MTGVFRSLISTCGLLIGLFFMTSGAWAQQVEVSSTLNPVGSGARATGMGGAFISVADDATAASWNPAGLIHLEKPEISVVGSYFSRSQTYHSDIHPEIESTNSMDTAGLNYASAAYPFVFLKHNMIVSLNYQRLYEMDKKVSFNYTLDIDGTKLNETIHSVQKGYLYALTPAFAIQVVPQLYIGATINFWGDYVGKNGWEQTYTQNSQGIFFGHNLVDKFDETSRTSFRGTNANIGFLWNVSGPITIGGVYKTAFNGKLRRETTSTQSQDLTDLSIHDESTTTFAGDLTMKMPASYGLGISYRQSDKWLIALDVYRTGWSRFSLVDSAGNEVNPLDAAPISEGRLKDTTQVRLGTEYLIIKEKYVVPVRAGVFYDPEPAKGSPDDFYGFSLGTGYSTSRFSLDASYQFRFGRRVTGDVPGIPGSSADINQHTVMMSLIYYF